MCINFGVLIPVNCKATGGARFVHSMQFPYTLIQNLRYPVITAGKSAEPEARSSGQVSMLLWLVRQEYNLELW